MMEEEYRLAFFEQHGFKRGVCKSCGSGFWTLEERDTCGDTPCVEYSFIGSPPINRPYDIDAMREKFLSFFEARGHTRIERYPVVARWRNDVFLVNASIYDFQPHVTSGKVQPPANPLTISQPCIRMTDLDSVGRTGKHTSSFEMMAHHVFNSKDNVIYWKEKTVDYCHEMLTKDLGVSEPLIIYKEHPWIGGGNAGPSLEVIVGGLEIATLVFMNLKEDKNGDVDLDGVKYSPLPLNVVDTGYGLERYVWASQGTPTIYDALYPDIVSQIIEWAGVEHSLEDERHSAILAENAKLAGLLDMGSHTKLMEMRKGVVKRLNGAGYKIELDEFLKLIRPIEAVYTIADHARTLALMLSDGIVPSNVKAGYLARLVVRRTLRTMEDLGLKVKLGDIVGLQMEKFSNIIDNSARDVVMDMLELETQRYGTTMSKGSKLVRSSIQKSGGGLDTAELIKLYDTHGVPPSIVQRIGKEMGAEIDVPDNFNALLAEKHKGERADETVDERHFDLPETKKLYYESPNSQECDAVVLHSSGGEVVLDQTIFYPDGGGQPADLGTITTQERTLKVTDVQSYGGVILHTVEGEVRVGEVVRLRLDWERRMGHTRHHTATHIVIGACREVLGKHSWQSGSQNEERHARIDIAHYKPITAEELRRIERLANEKVMAGMPVEKTFMGRDEAEKRFGFQLYQGGAPQAERLRVVRILDFDVEACGGTHVHNTSEIGLIKILRSERIQDGVERLVFSAGMAALEHVQGQVKLLDEASAILSVPSDQLPKTVQRFFDEWKALGKRVEKLSGYEAQVAADELLSSAGEVNGVRVIIAERESDMKSLQNLASKLAKGEKVAVILAARDNGVKVVVARSKDVELDCGQLIRELLPIVGGGGGGRPDFAQGGGPDESKIKVMLEKGRELVGGKL